LFRELAALQAARAGQLRWEVSDHRRALPFTRGKTASGTSEEIPPQEQRGDGPPGAQYQGLAALWAKIALTHLIGFFGHFSANLNLPALNTAHETNDRPAAQ